MLYIPVGPPGAKKSSLAKEMVEAGLITEDAVVSSDHYRKALTGDQTDQTVTSKVFKIVDTIVYSRLDRGLDVYLDATNLTKKDLDNTIAVCVTVGQPYTVMVTSLDEETLNELNNSEHRQEMGTVVPQHAMVKMFDRLKSLKRTLPETVVWSKDETFGLPDYFNDIELTTIEEMFERVADIRFSRTYEL